jgi:hypothetical protein
MYKDEVEFLHMLMTFADTHYRKNKNKGGHWLAVLTGVTMKHDPVIDDQIVNGLDHALKIAIRIFNNKEQQDTRTAKFLMSAYCDEAKNNPNSIHPRLQKWLDSCLEKIMQGEDANKAFGLKGAKGRKIGSTGLNYIKIACRFKLLQREGRTYEESEATCAKEFNTTERNVSHIVKKMKIPNVHDKILKDFYANDYGSMWMP